MAGMLLFVLCTFWSAWRITDGLAARDAQAPTRAERLIWAGIVGVAVWLAEGWVLALAGRFQAGPLLALAAAGLVAAWAATKRHASRVIGPSADVTAPVGGRVALGVALPFVLAGLWVAYSAAALSVTPVSNHDALSYHFPKAAQLALTGAFDLYPSQDLRVTYYPGNYEMLVATFLVFLRSDTATGLITSGSLLLFLATGFALFKRVWKDSTLSALGMAMILGSPVLLLHATAHKNDLLMAALTLNALVWLGRFAAHGGSGSAVVGVICVALATGTKFHGLFLALVATLPFWRAWRSGVWRPAPRQAAILAAGAAALFMLLGGAQYVANTVATGHFSGIEQVPTANAVNTVSFPALGQVPRFAWMLLAAPFLTAGQYFIVPWSSELWFWPAYELYFSHYGAHVSVLVLLLPLGIRWTRRTVDPATWAELTGISVPALLLVGLNALIGIRPYGSFAFIPRFLFFALPVLLAWTWCPWLAHFARVRSASLVPLAAALLIPVAYAGMTVTHDGFTPLSYVSHLWSHPERRRDVFHTSWRAATALDRMAPANATVAIDAGYDGWTYPLYGASLSRTVKMIVNAPEGYVPEPGIDWVVVDYAFPIVWGHPRFQSMAVADRYISTGTPSARELRVFRSLSANPDFTLAYVFPPRMQAVFRRVRLTRAAP
jgi:hypothetical protein